MAIATRGRITGRRLQARRLNVWSRDPRCAMCGKLVEFNDIPGRGFQLDHVQALKADGGKGEDTEANTQVLCCGPDGCHAKKTAQDMGYQQRRAVGLDGWPL
ncbi:HNH endonuclease [Paracidovorax citrulli]|uniref:HNH domain-containing protein n=2 Tax=Paracidovorax citrulli TaxID=80869 RepID=A1TN15_PARC0|nr:hypothetical protein Aave_1766 [Paracidovorax citrulli AAC00-1]ATG96958.1 HNH endonuclease [Paracidovorax citrulli]PVY66566.1 HNH endonuclease [Paracidovorax citrulli]REG69265.1 HNH endonuclease [Paracidovorax citrulli]RLJ93820.1 HNH endonuclease [Paracidovorax citrulli]